MVRAIRRTATYPAAPGGKVREVQNALCGEFEWPQRILGRQVRQTADPGGIYISHNIYYARSVCSAHMRMSPLNQLGMSLSSFWLEVLKMAVRIMSDKELARFEVLRDLVRRELGQKPFHLCGRYV